MLYPQQKQALDLLQVQIEKANKSAASSGLREREVDDLRKEVQRQTQAITQLKVLIEQYKTIENKWTKMKELLK